jgi:hypothetical protein
LARSVVARGENAAANSKRDIFEIRSVKLLYCRKKGIAVEVHDVLGEVSGKFELREKTVGIS